MVQIRNEGIRGCGGAGRMKAAGRSEHWSTGAVRGNELGKVYQDFSEKFREKSVKSLQSRKGLQSGKL